MVACKHASASGKRRTNRVNSGLPSPVKEGQTIVTLPPLVAAKLALYTAMRQQGVTKVALAARLGLSESVVRRLVNPEHRSHISQIEKALRAVGRKLAVEDQAA